MDGRWGAVRVARAHDAGRKPGSALRSTTSSSTSSLTTTAAARRLPDAPGRQEWWDGYQ